ncbi:hypothetical protein Trihar35433_1243 [Trichoderma harzianum]|nr:hypothetical protein Trihar35433_1243 [Trichoderma harzianum]
MNGVLAAIRPRCDAAGSNSVACFGGGSNSKQPQGSPLDPACQLPTGNARGDVFAVSLSPISHLHPTRFDLANPFDVTALSIAQSCLARVVCLSGQDGPMACEGFRRPSNGQISALHRKSQFAWQKQQLAPLRRHQETRRPSRLLAPMEWLDVFGRSLWGLFGSTAPLQSTFTHPLANPASKPPSLADWGHAVRERGSVPELPLGSVLEAFTS